MANYTISPTWVTKDTALFWDNGLRLVGQFDRQWNKEWNNKPKGSQIGDTVQIRTPQRWTVTEGQALQQQAILNQTVPLTLNHQYNVGMGWSSIEDTLEIEEVQDRYTRPAGVALANKTDAIAGYEVYKSVYNVVGTPGVPVTSNKVWTDAVALLAMTGTPDGYVAVIDPLQQSELLNANFALFGKQYQNYFRTGQFSEMALGVDEWYVDPLLPIHTTGNFAASTPVVAGANQTGSVLNISGMGAYSLKAGDAFYIVGPSVHGVNPLAYTSTGMPQRFVLQADAAGTGTAALQIAPPIVTAGQLQTVTNSPPNGAAIQFIGATGTVAATMATTASRQQLIFNPAAFAFVSAPLTSDLPGARSKVVTNGEVKLSMRWAEQWNIQTDQKPSRVDILIGVAAIQPYFAVRIMT